MSLITNFWKKEFEFVKDYNSIIIRVSKSNESLCGRYYENKIIEKTLISGTKKYDPIVIVFENSKDIFTLSVT